MPPSSGYPTATSGLLPKDETRVSDLILATGQDGTGVTVAVLDTGVDPGAPGLQTTTQGIAKVIDVIDCTGAGDVNMSTKATATASSTLQGLSGRTLTLSDEMVRENPSKEYRIGLKHGFDLFPSRLVSRLRKERRSVWDKQHRHALNSVRRQLAGLRDAASGKEDAKEKSFVEELEARQTVLLAAEKNYRDVGPVFDCVQFFDGTRWRAVVDTSEEGDLAKCELLEDYHVRYRYGEFGNGVMMHFVVNIYEDGDVLSIVVDGDSHGTHVAGILAANFPGAPHLNGLAPGAQIVSLKIGDSRLSNMETHQGTIRALSYLLHRSMPDCEENDIVLPNPTNESAPAEDAEHAVPAESTLGSDQSDPPDSKPPASPQTRSSTPSATRKPPRIDVANMSFGEHSRDVDKGRFVDLVNKLVHKHNVLFLSSAGNDGPALSSVSAPGGTTEALIGVGAYVTPNMLTQAYSLLDSEFGFEGSTAAIQDGPVSCDNVPSTPSEHTVASGAQAEMAATMTTDGRMQPGEAVVGIPYTWSSRGPVPNGAMGVSICAPGGAIAPVPVWTVRKKMLMNGTSMASPSAAGAVTVVLSVLKSRGIPYTSALVRRAIENTARPLKPPRLGPDLGEKGRMPPINAGTRPRDKFDSEYYRDLVFAVGNGSIDAMAACEYLQHYDEKRRRYRSVVGGVTKAIKAEQEPTVATENGPTAPVVDKPDNLDVSLDNPMRLEEWRVRVRIEDGSLARRGSSSPGCGSLNTTRGIYLRGESDTSAVHRAIVTVEAIAQKEDCSKMKWALANMEVHLSLHCEASWVEVPSTLVLLGGGRSFPVFVDPTGLQSGNAHFAEIVAYVVVNSDVATSSGPIFRVPVAVHKPEALVDEIRINPLQEVWFAPGAVVRRFYEAPTGATYAVLKVTAGNAAVVRKMHMERANGADNMSAVECSEVSSRQTVAVEDGVGAGESGTDAEGEKDAVATPSSADARNFEAHVVQICPQKHCAEMETKQYFTLRPGTVKEMIIKVAGGATLELCLAQIWSSPGRSLIDKVELVFGGVVPSPSAVHAGAGSIAFPRVEVGCFLGGGVRGVSGFVPRGSLTHLRRVVSAGKSKISLLGGRDLLLEVGAVSQLMLEYVFEMFEGGNVKLLFPGLNGCVYESEVEGGPYVMVFDRNKQLMFASDIYPAETFLAKGEYVAVAYVRHDSVDLLERLEEMKLTVQYDIEEISLDAFESSHGASMGLDDRRVSRSIAGLESRERRAFYFGVPKKGGPKWAAVGDTFVGKMWVDKVLSAAGSSMRRGSDIPSYAISLGVAGKPKVGGKKGKEAGDEKEEGKGEKEEKREGGIEENPEQWFEEAVRKVKLKRLRSLLRDRKFVMFDGLDGGMKDKYPDDVELGLLRVERLDVELGKLGKKEDVKKDEVDKVVEMLVKEAEVIIRRLDETGIATHFGMLIDGACSEESSRRRNFETKRTQLIEALFRKARALQTRLEMGEVDEEGKKGYEEAIKQLGHWVSLDPKTTLCLPSSANGSGQKGMGSVTNEDLVMFVAKRELLRERCGVALNVMDTYYGAPPSKKVESVEMVRFREQLFDRLGWIHLVERECCARVIRFPAHRVSH